jgi:hypothetical protein
LKEAESAATPQVLKTIILNTKNQIEVINKKIEQALKDIKEVYAQKNIREEKT